MAVVRQHVYRMGKYKRIYVLRERWVLSLVQRKYTRRTQGAQLFGVILHLR